MKRAWSTVVSWKVLTHFLMNVTCISFRILETFTIVTGLLLYWSECFSFQLPKNKLKTWLKVPELILSINIRSTYRTGTTGLKSCNNTTCSEVRFLFEVDPVTGTDALHPHLQTNPAAGNLYTCCCVVSTNLCCWCWLLEFSTSQGIYLLQPSAISRKNKEFDILWNIRIWHTSHISHII